MGCNGMHFILGKQRLDILTCDSYDLLRPDYLWTARARW